jgi:MazG family protein
MSVFLHRRGLNSKLPKPSWVWYIFFQQIFMKKKKKNLIPPLPHVAFFLNTVQHLRDPKKGCPWDLAQTHLSLTKYLIEEVAEFIDCLEAKGIEHPDTLEELSDVLLQIGLHAQMASEKKLFNFEKVAKTASQKIIERHPHVFDPNFPKFKTPEEVSKAWELIKAKIRKKKAPQKTQDPPISKSLMSVPRALPALQRASRLGEKMASFGFDWRDPKPCFDKITEEIQELEGAKSPDSQQEEWGDLVFALSQWARLKGWDAESLLQKANDKFISRSQLMEKLALNDGKNFTEIKTDQERDLYWEKAKQKTAKIKKLTS